MKSIVIGTAGHIDHGKTELIKALTGIDTDRLPEEKRRGITLDLGFANLKLKNNKEIGIIDVPGHEKFIKHMVAGVTGIDLALMVIALDEGIKPQTIEHLDILNLLHVSNGIIVLTKMDLVDENLIKNRVTEVKEFVKGSFLENEPIIPVSSKTGEGLQYLTKELEDVIDIIPEYINKNKMDKFSIGHFGALYQSRNLKYFLAALQEAFVEEPDMSSRFALELYGGIFGEEIRDQIDCFPYKVINYHGMIKRKDSLIQESKCAVLLLVQNADQRSSVTIPSKVYEYLYLRKPILGLVFNNHELKTMIESHGHIVADATNIAQIKMAIIDYYHKWDKGQLDDIIQYVPSDITVEKACEQLIRVAESSIAENR